MLPRGFCRHFRSCRSGLDVTLRPRWTNERTKGKWASAFVRSFITQHGPASLLPLLLRNSRAAHHPLALSLSLPLSPLHFHFPYYENVTKAHAMAHTRNTGCELIPRPPLLGFRLLVGSPWPRLTVSGQGLNLRPVRPPRHSEDQVQSCHGAAVARRPPIQADQRPRDAMLMIIT